jgi:hypothetical protein
MQASFSCTRHGVDELVSRFLLAVTSRISPRKAARADDLRYPTTHIAILTIPLRHILPLRELAN